MGEYAFAGSVPTHYDEGLGPVIFEPYAVETAGRLSGVGKEWLEVAAGTGRVTRHLTTALSPDGRLVATDLNPEMLAVARTKIDDPRVRFETADATALPYADGSFDAVFSQFGAMFYPDREAGHREARRVLRSGGAYLLVSWAAHADNPWAATAWEVVTEAFPEDPPGFLRVPFSYFGADEIEGDLRRAGFEEVRIEEVVKPLVASDARAFARGAVVGNPLGAEILAQGGDPEAMVDRLAEAFVARFGDRPMRSEVKALITMAR